MYACDHALGTVCEARDEFGVFEGIRCEFICVHFPGCVELFECVCALVHKCLIHVCLHVDMSVSAYLCLRVQVSMLEARLYVQVSTRGMHNFGLPCFVCEVPRACFLPEPAPSLPAAWLPIAR